MIKLLRFSPFNYSSTKVHCINLKRISKHKKEYDRAVWALSRGVIGQPDVILSWETMSPAADTNDHTHQILRGSELGQHFECLSAKKLAVNTERKTLRNLQVPIINTEKMLQMVDHPSGQSKGPTPSRSLQKLQQLIPDSQEKTTPQQSLNPDFMASLGEWIGALHNRVRNYVEAAEVDLDVSSLTHDSLESVYMHGCIFDYEGFITPNFIAHQLEQMKKLVDGAQVPYGILTAWAFEDHSRSSLEYGVDAYYTIVILPNDQYLIIRPQKT